MDTHVRLYYNGQITGKAWSAVLLNYVLTDSSRKLTAHCAGLGDHSFDVIFLYTVREKKMYNHPL